MLRNLSLGVLLIGVLCLPAWSHGRSISTVGDIKIDITGDTFTCDKVVCPVDTDRCVVTKENDANNAGTLVRSNMCYSTDNKLLKQSITNETIGDNTNVKVHIVAFRNGMTSIINSHDSYTSTNFDGQLFKQEMADWRKELQREVQSIKQEFSGFRPFNFK